MFSNNRSQIQSHSSTGGVKIVSFRHARMKAHKNTSQQTDQGASVITECLRYGLEKIKNHLYDPIIRLEIKETASRSNAVNKGMFGNKGPSSQMQEQLIIYYTRLSTSLKARHI